MHICIWNLTIIDSDNGVSPDWRQAIIWANDGIVLFGPLQFNFNDIYLKCISCRWRKCIWKCHLENVGHLSRPQCVKKQLRSTWLVMAYSLYGIIAMVRITWELITHPIPTSLLFPSVFNVIMPIQWLPTEYQIHIWQVPLQFSYNNASHLWLGVYGPFRWLCKIRNIYNGEKCRIEFIIHYPNDK